MTDIISLFLTLREKYQALKESQTQRLYLKQFTEGECDFTGAVLGVWVRTAETG